MSQHAFKFRGAELIALASGALYWPAQGLLCVSDLHFGKAQRFVAQGAAALPPYETHDTLLRLDQDITATQARTVICLGDSFDSLQAGNDLDDNARSWITRMQAGRRWIWIEGNHDPGPVGLGGSHQAEHTCDGLVFRHIADDPACGEISGHFHPKISLKLKSSRITRRCFAFDERRLVMPAYGTYTGGLSVLKHPLATLLDDPAICILVGNGSAHAIPRPKTAPT
ncbi:ligase-associated DNA damage response endonuclease PdeM [Planktotalea sp.]|uniref:ligase-associated DNA damage response endonuclease PdeM n=1 Tax=Planktotalea sp. TaxID=2029877 RepID=UPI003D6B6743